MFLISILNDKAVIDRVLDFADRELRGTTLGYDIGKALHNALLTINPAKKRKLKDAHFDTKVGLVITESDIVAAAKERDESKKKGPKETLRLENSEKRTCGRPKKKDPKTTPNVVNGEKRAHGRPKKK